MKKIFSIFIFSFLLSWGAAFAVDSEIESGNSTSTVIGTDEEQRLEIELDIQRVGDDVAVIVNVPSPVEFGGWAFQLYVPQGFEFSSTIEGDLLVDAEGSIDAFQNEDGILSVEFSGSSDSPVEGELMGIIFAGNNSGGLFEIKEDPQNIIVGIGGNNTLIYTQAILDPVWNGVATSTPEATGQPSTTQGTTTPTNNTTTSENGNVPAVNKTQDNNAESVVVDSDNITPETISTGTGSSETTGSGTSDEAMGELGSETTETETGLEHNLLILAFLILLVGAFATRKKQA